MRVMQVMAGAATGGAEAFFMRLVPALKRAGVDQEIIIRKHPDRAAELRANGLQPLELAFGGIFDCITGHRLTKAIARYQPEILLSWMNRATRFCPVGSHVFAARLGGYYKLENYRRCDHLIGNTQDICDYLIAEGWPANRTWYLPNFVDAAIAPQIPRTELNTPEDAPLLLALGRLHPNKAFDVLLEAIVKVPRAYLWLAGDGPLDHELKSQADKLGIADRVRFLGWRNDVAALFAACDMLVCPSRHEPLGNIIIEAWAQGRPLVSASSQGPSGLVKDGLNGLLVPIDNAEALADAINRVLVNPDLAETLVSAGRVSYQAEFTEAAVVSRYLEFFTSITR